MSIPSILLGLGALVAGVASAGALPADALPEGDPAAGRKIANMCRTCHGIDGIAQMPVAPNIGGEPATYLATQLLAFRSGERVNEMMSVVAASLSDQQIADVAAWYGAHSVSAVLPANFDAAAAPELCSSCHGADGIAQIPDAPHLAGENAIYLDTQLKAFRSGRRQHEIMSPIAAQLSDEDIRAVANWYASIGLQAEGP